MSRRLRRSAASTGAFSRLQLLACCVRSIALPESAESDRRRPIRPVNFFSCLLQRQAVGQRGRHIVGRLTAGLSLCPVLSSPRSQRAMSSPGAVPGWSTPAAAADLLPPVPWVRPMIRRPLPPQCKMIAVRGEERWEFATGEPPAADPTEPSVAPVESSSPAVEALEQQMEHLAVSSASPSPPTPGVAAAASTASPAKGTPPKKLKQNSSSSSADTPAPAVKSNGKNKQQAKHTESTDGAQGSPSPSISSLFVPPGHTLSSLTTLQLSHVLSGLLPGLEYAATLGSKERVTMHAAAEERGLEHESLGFRPRRHLYVQRKYEAAEGEEAKQQCQ
jgi:hypothetical protein